CPRLRVTEPELPVIVVSPAPQGVIDARGAGVEEAALDGGPVGVMTDLGRHLLAGPGAGVAEPELAHRVVAPAPQRVVEPNAAGVGATGTDCSPIRVAANLDGDEPTRGVTEPELTEVVVSPAPQGVIAANAARVISTFGEAHPD